MSVQSDAANLEVIVAGVRHHNASCDNPALAVVMNHYEVERLGWDEILGIPVRGDKEMGTGAFRVVCDGLTQKREETEEVEAPSPAERTLQPA